MIAELHDLHYYTAIPFGVSTKSIFVGNPTIENFKLGHYTRFFGLIDRLQEFVTSVFPLVQPSNKVLPSILEALGIIEDAVYRCREKSIDTPAIREALDVLQSNVTGGRQAIAQFRNALIPTDADQNSLEAQQQLLQATFGQIHNAVRGKLKAHLMTLEYRHRIKPDETVKAELERLAIKLEGMPEEWRFIPW
jgi:hypothetical protein